MTPERLKEIREVAAGVSDRSVIPELLVHIDALQAERVADLNLMSAQAEQVDALQSEVERLLKENQELKDALAKGH